MSKKFGVARRVPRKIGSENEEELASSTAAKDASDSILIRPRPKPRNAVASRTSFNIEDEEEEGATSTGLVAPKRSKLSRVAIQRNAAQRTSLLPSDIPRRPFSEEDSRPSYSAASLQELKESTPRTPQELTTDTSNSDVDDVASNTQALDISSKFGSHLSRYQQSSAIPSAAEIAEKKARRARLAKEQVAEEYISLDPDDPGLDNDDDEDDNVMRDEQGRLVLKPKDKYKDAESRLTHDDEDIMENFEEFTEADSKIVFGRKQEMEAARRRKADMAAQIAAAEGASDSDSDVSERERNEAFEAAQTKHGTYGTNNTSSDPHAHTRPRTPPTISPLPTVDAVVERLRKQVADLQTSRMQKLQEMEALQREKIRLGEEEIRIQNALRETAEKFHQLRAERGIAEPSVHDETSDLQVANVASRISSAPDSEMDSGASSDIEDVNGGRGGLGFGIASRGLDA